MHRYMCMYMYIYIYIDIFVILMIILITVIPSSTCQLSAAKTLRPKRGFSDSEKHGSFVIRRQRGHPGVVLLLVVSNSTDH